MDSIRCRLCWLARHNHLQLHMHPESLMQTLRCCAGVCTQRAIAALTLLLFEDVTYH